MVRAQAQRGPCVSLYYYTHTHTHIYTRVILCRRSSGEKGTTSFSSSTEAVERAFNRTRRISITMSSDLFFGDWKSHGVSTDHIFFRTIEGNCSKSETVVWRFVVRSRMDRIGSDRVNRRSRIETMRNWVAVASRRDSHGEWIREKHGGEWSWILAGWMGPVTASPIYFVNY